MLAAVCALRCFMLYVDADQHLESSTKRTLVENEMMVAELAYHTAQVSSERNSSKAGATVFYDRVQRSLQDTARADTRPWVVLIVLSCSISSGSMPCS